MPPNFSQNYQKKSFAPIYPRTNVSAMNLSPMNVSRKNRVAAMLNKKVTPQLNQTRRIRFSNTVIGSNNTQNTLHNGKNTRGKVRDKEWNISPNNYTVKERNNLLNLMNDRFSDGSGQVLSRYDILDKPEKEFINRLYRLSVPSNSSYRRAFYRGEYTPEIARMMAKLSMKYTPEEMKQKVQNLPLNDSTKQSMIHNISLMYNKNTKNFVNSPKLNSAFDPVYNGNMNQYVKTLKNKYKNRNEQLKVLNRNLTMNTQIKRIIRNLL
jgi:hypothetical protein